ncbi:MAG: GNAT family N-acetyltransferase [Candidatus Peribacter sp.]|jgi:[ribosomal protein S5]-alanine N-acetyltransferase|nr:GNAT family N-acetyltransferase [Candidatus Peribacter sp.]
MHFAHRTESFTGERLILRTMTEGDATQTYAEWINNPEVNLYLETKSATIEELIAYIEQKDAKDDTLFFGIFLKEEGTHIGTIKLEPIEPEEKKATIAIMIGDKEQWGKGYAGESMQLLINWCFDDLGFEKIELGAIGKNTAAIHAYEKLGFAEVRREVGSVQYGDEVHDHVLMELKRPV